MQVIEYKPEYRDEAVELMAELQEVERALSADRTPANAMAADHFEYLLEVCETQQGQVFLAIVENQLVGFCVVFLETEDNKDLHLLAKYRTYGCISDLIVKQSHRRTGAASLLMNAAERYCASIGVARLNLAVLHNNASARRFYEKAGYRSHEVIYCKDIL